MTATERYIHDEVKVIEKDCQGKHISPRKWVEKYAAEYHRMYWNGGMHKLRMLDRKGVRQ